MTEALPPLRQIIDDFDLGAKKSLGQHFLLDLNITRKIANSVMVSDRDTILEIGPGPGGLTRALLEAGAHVIAIERDQRCVPALSMLNDHFDGRLRLIEHDALDADEIDIVGVSAPVKIVANLPYNISTELLIKWLKLGPALWSTMALMFQKEVADRILATPGSKVYGRLSVISQLLSKPRRAFDLPARAFTPPPKVDSTVVIFERTEGSEIQIEKLERVTQAAFSQRRKMLRASLKSVFGADVNERLQSLGIDATARAETLTPSQFRELSEIT